ncbi:MAG: fimbrillin family protein [Prevotella sp.]|nr:fimbrillin family protein [Prevotella sp.]
MKRKYYIRMIVCSLAALVLTACTDELEQEQMPGNGRGIGFSASVTNGWDNPATTRTAQADSIGKPVQMEGSGQALYLHAEVLDGIIMRKNDQPLQTTTRGEMRTATNMYGAIGVMGYSFSGSWDGTLTPDFMCNLKAAKGGSVYKTTTYWPNDESTNIRFYAYAPHSDDADGITPSLASVAGIPQLAYEVPADVTKQSDLLATLCDETATAPHTSPQDIEFHHLLTAVCFKIGDSMADGTINKITLKNIKYKGTYTFPAVAPWTTDKGSWTISDDDTKDFTCSPAFATTGMANVQVNTGNQVFMMLPQELSGDAAVEIEFTPSGESTAVKYTTTLQGRAYWNQGQTVTYTISINPTETQYVLSVDENLLEYRPDGIYENTLNVVSYKQTGNTIEPVKWMLNSYSLDEGDTWVTTTYDKVVYYPNNYPNKYGDGGATPQEVTIVLLAAPFTTTTPFSEALTNKAAESDCDLSLRAADGSVLTERNTANCYVIHGPGTYKFPVVYGNAIKKGTTNTKAYHSSCTDTQLAQDATPHFDTAESAEDGWKNTTRPRILYNFKNGYGDDITDPWIQNNTHDGNAIVPTTASIVWQDFNYLIRPESVRLTQEDGKYFVNFEVRAEDIYEGNAVIQVSDADGTVLWSWHIWATDEDLSQQWPLESTESGNTYNWMKVPVGYVDNTVTYTYPGRDILARIVQSESGKQAIVRLRQTRLVLTDEPLRQAPYYQWGRKDPMPATNVEGFNFQFASTADSRVNFWQAITHPGTFYGYSGYNWFKGCALPESELTDANKSNNVIHNLWDQNCIPKWGSNRESGIIGYLTLYVGKCVKTVYDPCPVGFHVAERDSWSTIEKVVTDHDGGYNDDLYIPYYAWHSTVNGQEVYIPSLGYRQGNKATNDGVSLWPFRGYYWCATGNTAVMSATEQSITLFQFSTDGNNFNGRMQYNQVFGCSVMAIADDETPITYSPTVNPWDESQGETTVPMSSN